MIKVAIIGAGPSGLTAAKACLEEGMSPHIFEKSDKIGGVWQGGPNGQAWAGMRTNLSRWNCMFSDFPWPENFLEEFPQQEHMAAYLKNYAEHFRVMSRIQTDTPVLSAQKSEAGWIVTTKQGTELFDRMIVASGFFSKPAFDSTQNIVPASAFKSATDFDGKRVTVVGGSFSGYEIASELARNNVEVIHIVRTPIWIIGRRLNGTPMDILFNTRAGQDMPLINPDPAFNNRLTAQFFESAFGNPGMAHLELDIDSMSGQPNFVAISEDYLSLVASGKIDVCVTGLKSMTEHELQLEDGRVLNRDITIMATGYKTGLDYMDEATREKMDFDGSDMFMPLPLHKTVWPKNTDHLAFVGFYRGPYFAVMELQARWAAAVMAGSVAPPSQESIIEGVQAAKNLRLLKPKIQFPYADYVGLCDELAGEIGVKPILDADDPMRDYLANGPVIPAQFRLCGHKANREMAERIISTLPVPKP